MCDCQQERRHAQPGYVSYRPRSVNRPTFDANDEHIFALDKPDGLLVAIWIEHNDVLWHPPCIGKRITHELLSDLSVPRQDILETL